MPRIITVVIDDHTAALLDELVASEPAVLREHTLECLTQNLLQSCADGWRRPGAWERGMLTQLGFADDAPLEYSPPASYEHNREAMQAAEAVAAGLRLQAAEAGVG